MTRISAVALACVCSLAASSTMAASSASVSLGNLSFTLIDLDPFDGLTPTVNFLTGNGSTALSVNAADTSIGESESAGRTRPGTFSFSKEFLAELTNANASATVGSTSLSAHGVANGLGTSFSASASTGGVSGYYYSGPLTVSLSANAALLISADLSLSAAASNSTCTYYYYCSTSDQATASGSLSLSYSYSGNGASVSYNQTDTNSLQATATGGYSYGDYRYNPNTGYYEYVYITTPGTDESKSLTDVLSARFVNMTSSSQSASLGLSVSVSGTANSAALSTRSPALSPVPEADSVLMGLGGLGVIGVMLRRRRA